MIWHAYTVEQPEFGRYCEWHVIDAMRDMGGEAFAPYEIRWIRVKRGGARFVRQRRYPLYPGYVFGGFERVPWSKLMQIKGITGVVQFAGEPARLSKRDLSIARAMNGAPANNNIYRSSFRAGDEARIMSGPFRDWVARISAIVDGRATIPIRFFGCIRDVRVDVADLEAV